MVLYRKMLPGTAILFCVVVAVNSLDGSTVAPTQRPVPDAQEGTYAVNDTTGVTCLLLNIAVQMEFIYQDTGGKMQTVKYNVPTNSTVDGSCTKSEEHIKLKWDKDWNLQFSFTTDGKNFQLSSSSLKFNRTDYYFPNIASQSLTVVEARAENLTDIEAKLGNSYVCNNADDIAMTENVTLHLSDLQVQAFIDKKLDGKFGPAQECEADTKPSNIVPIAVGAALAGLVLIVLIAYIIGRNRNTRGYESV